MPASVSVDCSTTGSSRSLRSPGFARFLGPLRARNRRRRLVVLGAMVVWLGTSACATWPEIESSPPRQEALASAGRIRVLTTDGRKIELEHDVRIVGDSLIGWREAPERLRPEPEGREAIALADIESIRRRQGQPVLTGVVIVGGTLLGFSLICAANDCYNLGDLGFSN